MDRGISPTVREGSVIPGPQSEPFLTAGLMPAPGHTTLGRYSGSRNSAQSPAIILARHKIPMTRIIRVENLSKQYRIGNALSSYTTLREKMAEMIQTPLKRLRNGNHTQQVATIWALKDVSF